MDFYLFFKILFLLCFFGFLGLFLYFSYSIDGFENKDCPDLLLQNGEQYYLYNTKKPTIKGVNPIVFSRLSDYSYYVSQHQTCPVLFLQKGSDAQGNEVYNVRGGTPMEPSNYNGLDTFPPLANGRKFNINNVRVTSFVDSSLQNPPYNSYNTPGYAGFDPRGFDVGRFNPMDEIHISGELLPISDSPSDPNWGGIEYTKKMVQSGKYIGNEVYRPIFSGGPNVTIA